ncbi:MAG: hypothetical protein CMH83_15950 [Nocardioides sp.]|nr:hypothetical protein [Nocardioides sp.]
MPAPAVRRTTPTAALAALALVLVVALALTWRSGVPAADGAAPSGALGAARGQALRLSWDGVKGVRPGMKLTTAAKKLHTRVDKSCAPYGGHWYVHKGRIYLNDIPLHDRRVDWISTTATRVSGPWNIDTGDTFAKARRVAKKHGTRLRAYRNREAGGAVTAYSVRGPRGRVLVLTPRYRYDDSGAHSTGRVGSMSLVVNQRAAKVVLRYQGGC